MADWETLTQACAGCNACALSQTRTNVVFGVGDRHTKLMFIGEAPGEQEDLQGEPFVGAAGKLLDDLLNAVGMTREQVYIANILKCRPPHNRDPLPAEEDACMHFLREQTALIHPKMIVCLGRIAACRIIRPDYKITKEHGTWMERKGCWISATYHPAFVLRDPRRRPDVYLDFVEIARRFQVENPS